MTREHPPLATVSNVEFAHCSHKNLLLHPLLDTLLPERSPLNPEWGQVLKLLSETPNFQPWVG